jgi:hypothetical protein
MRLVLLFLSLPMAASAEWASSLAKAESDAKAKRCPVLLYVFSKGDPACDRLEKEVWAAEPAKTLLRSFIAVKVDKANIAAPKTWESVPRWKAQAEGEAAIGDIRILHPWGKERERFSLKDATAADAGQKIKAASDAWEKEQEPIRADARNLELALKAKDKDLIDTRAAALIAHHEPWTLPLVASCLYVYHFKLREMVIPELRRIEPEDGLWALVKWLDDQATQPGCNSGWKEVAKANDIRTLPMIKDGILNNADCSVTRVRAIAQFQDRSNIPFLIDLFPRVGVTQPKPGEPPKPSLHDDIAAALETLTGQHVGKDYNQWKEWWKSAGPQFEFPK